MRAHKKPTDSRGTPLVPFAATLEDLPRAILSDLADALELPASDEPLEAVTAAMRDRERTLARLRALPAYALLVLEVLAEGGGRLHRSELAREVGARTGVPDGFEDSLQFLSAYGFVLSAGRAITDRITLVAPEASTIAEFVTGVSYPGDAPPEPPEDAEVLAREREMLALATLTAHRKLRWTADGAPHRTTLRSFSRGLGPSEGRIAELLHAGLRSGLIRGTADRTDPRVAGLLDAALHRLRAAPGAPLATIEALVPREGWISAVAIAPHLAIFSSFGGRTAASAASVVSACRERFVVREHAGHSWIGRPARPPSRSGDGHVTPNLEILLGAQAHPEIVVSVGLFAELVRLDRVLTFRISAASVAAGLAAGSSLETFLEALDRVGRHPVPDNVRITVQDFASRVARVSQVWALEVPVSATESLLREFGAAAFGSPKPGLVLLSGDVKLPAVSKALERIGLKPSVPESSARDGHDVALEVPARTLHSPDAGLRKSVTQAASDRFLHSAAAMARAKITIRISPDRDAAGTARAARDELKENGGPPLTVRALDRLASLLDGASQDIEAWAKKLPPSAATEARDAALSPVALIPYAALPELERRRALSEARSFAALLYTCEAALDAGKATADGERILAAFYTATPGHSPAQRSVEASEPGPRRIRPGPGFESELHDLALDDALATVAIFGATGKIDQFHVAALTVRSRGTERVLLATDLATDEGHVFPLSKIAWIEVDGEELDYDFDDDDDDDDDLPPQALQELSRRLTGLARRGQPGAGAAISSSPFPHTGRNAPCPCGSGKKYKRCHGADA